MQGNTDTNALPPVNYQPIDDELADGVSKLFVGQIPKDVCPFLFV